MSTKHNINSDSKILVGSIPVTGLLTELKQRLDCLSVNTIDEDLAVTTAYTIYQAENKAWLTFPVPRIRKIDSTGLEFLLVDGTDYSINYAAGSVTLVSALTANDSVRADYNFDVFTDDQLNNILIQSAREVKLAVHRSFDTTNVPEDYKEAILKRAFSNAFKCLMEPTFGFYHVNVGGRDIDKTMLVDSIKKIIDENEELLSKDINTLRNFNQTNRFQ